VIKPTLEANGSEWKGWHAYRRGLATNLKKLGVPDTTIQAILRHENVSTTQRFYIKTAHQDAMDAMRRFEEKLKCAADGELIVGKLLKRLEPTIGLEPMTCRLRIDGPRPLICCKQTT